LDAHRRVNAPSPTNDARVNHVGPTRTAVVSTYQNPVRSRGGAGFLARPHHAALRAPTGETCRRCMGSYSRRQLFAPLLALQAPQGRHGNRFSPWSCPSGGRCGLRHDYAACRR
jgi:hypothetical protein